MKLIVVPWLPSVYRGRTTHAITIAPYVFIRPEWKDDPGILAHEQVHLDRVAEVGWLKWYWNYVFDLDFRRKEEELGRMAQWLVNNQLKETNV